METLTREVERLNRASTPIKDGHALDSLGEY